MRGRGFGLPLKVCVAYVNVLVGFMSEKVTDTAFDSTSCVGSAGTGAAWTESLAGGQPTVRPAGGAERSWQHVLTHLELQRPS